MEFYFLIAIVVMALVFDFINGFHDAANSIATIVATRVLSPRVAVAGAAFFNFLAFWLFDLKVANTIATGLVNIDALNLMVVMAALVSAIAWNLLTWYLGLPSSSSHALIGGIIGASVAHAGFQCLHVKNLIKVLASIVVSPFLGWMLGFFFIFMIYWMYHKSKKEKAEPLFVKLQIFSASLISIGHGANDAQKTIGIIAMAFCLFHHQSPQHLIAPTWSVFLCYFTIALGTLMGGWRIVRTMGTQLTKLRPVHGFCAECSAAVVLFFATHVGIPVSTTHTITGSILGVGSIRGLASVRWNVAQRIIWAWILTIPATAGISCMVFYILPSCS